MKGAGYFVMGVLIGVVLATISKPPNHQAVINAAVSAATKAIPPPAPIVAVPVPVPHPLPCPPTVAASLGPPASPQGLQDVFPKPAAPYTIPRIGNPGLRDCTSLDKIVIRASEVKAIKPSGWQKWKKYCCYPDNLAGLQNDAMRAWNGTAGVEHYALLSHLANHFGELGGAAFGELGSKEGASAMAMGVHPKVTVFAYDVYSVYDHVAKVMRSRQQTEVAPMAVQEAMPNIHFMTANLTDSTKPLHASWRKLLLGTRVLLLDTLHEPVKNPFEYEMLQYFADNNYAGVILLDDINLSPDMKRFWQWCKDKFGDRATDVTRIGHYTGTGYIDFCGNTEFIWD